MGLPSLGTSQVTFSRSCTMCWPSPAGALSVPCIDIQVGKKATLWLSWSTSFLSWWLLGNRREAGIPGLNLQRVKRELVAALWQGEGQQPPSLWNSSCTNSLYNTGKVPFQAQGGRFVEEGSKCWRGWQKLKLLLGQSGLAFLTLLWFTSSKSSEHDLLLESQVNYFSF